VHATAPEYPLQNFVNTGYKGDGEIFEMNEDAGIGC